MTGQGEDKLGSFLTKVEGLTKQHQWANNETALKTILENWFFGAAVGGYTLTAEYGSFIESGQVLNLLADRKIGIGYESFTENGQIVGLLIARQLGIDYGSFTESGQYIDLIYSSGEELPLPIISFKKIHINE